MAPVYDPDSEGIDLGDEFVNLWSKRAEGIHITLHSISIDPLAQATSSSYYVTLPSCNS